MTNQRLKISPTGPEFSRIIAGMWRLAEWNLSPAQRLTWIHQVLDLGITTFDHADIYGDYTIEALFGEALALEPSLRNQMELVSKCGIKLISKNRPSHLIKQYDTSRAHIIASVEQSLVNLHTDHLDLLLIHRPDPLMDFDEVAETFRLLQQAGKVRHFGVSNFTRHQFEVLNKRFPLVTNQVEFSPLHVAPLYDEVFDGLQDLGVSPMIWSALGGGKLFTGESEAAKRVQAIVSQLAESLHTSFASVVYAWILQHPSKPIPLTGSGRIPAIQEAVAALDVKLSNEQWFAILEAANGHRVP